MRFISNLTGLPVSSTAGLGPVLALAALAGCAAGDTSIDLLRSIL